jgi:hypothetical protein
VHLLAFNFIYTVYALTHNILIATSAAPALLLIARRRSCPRPARPLARPRDHGLASRSQKALARALKVQSNSITGWKKGTEHEDPATIGVRRARYATRGSIEIIGNATRGLIDPMTSRS